MRVLVVVTVRWWWCWWGSVGGGVVLGAQSLPACEPGSTPHLRHSLLPPSSSLPKLSQASLRTIIIFTITTPLSKSQVFLMMRACVSRSGDQGSHRSRPRVSNIIHMCACACAGWKIPDPKYHVAYSVGFHSLTVTICQQRNRVTKTLKNIINMHEYWVTNIRSSKKSKKTHNLKFWSLMISFCPKVKRNFKERCLLWQSPTFIVWSCYVNCASWVSPLFVITASIRLKPDFFNIWDFSTPQASHCD